MLIKTLTTLGIFMLYLYGAQASQLNAWIETKAEANRLQVIPYARSAEDILIRYQLSAEKSGSSGTTHNHQSSRVNLAADTVTPLSRLTLSRDVSDQYRFVLKIYQNNQLIAEKQLTLPPD